MVIGFIGRLIQVGWAKQVLTLIIVLVRRLVQAFSKFEYNYFGASVFFTSQFWLCTHVHYTEINYYY